MANKTYVIKDQGKGTLSNVPVNKIIEIGGTSIEQAAAEYELILTTAETTGASTYNASTNTLNIPNYTVSTAFIPLAGTEVGKPVTGEVKFAPVDNFSFSSFNSLGERVAGHYQSEGDNENYYLVRSLSNASVFCLISPSGISFFEDAEDSGYGAFSKVANAFFIQSPSDTNFRGLTGGDDYSPNITDLDYTQKIYVDTKIPLSGTEVGKPITGNLEVADQSGISLFSKDAFKKRQLLFNDEGGVEIKQSDEVTSSDLSRFIVNSNGISATVNNTDFSNITAIGANLGIAYLQAQTSDGQSGLELSVADLRVNSTNPDFKGLQGQFYYGANYDSLTYVQKKYVDDNFEPILGNPSTDGYILSSTTAGVRSWIAPSGGGTTETASNGLNKLVNDIKLGGTLTENTTITAGAFYLQTTGNLDTQSIFRVNNTATNGIGISSMGSGTFGTGISAEGGSVGLAALSENGYGINVASTNGVGARIVSNNFSSYALEITKTNNNTSTLVNIASLSAVSHGTVTTGFGGLVDISLEDDSNNINLASSLVSKWTDATSATRTSEFSIRGVNNAITTTVLQISGAGIFTLTQGLVDYADDAAAAVGGIPVNALYRTGSIVKIRVS